MFRDRKQAGILLAAKLSKFYKSKEAIVLAIPRGGVVVGYEISRGLELPLDVLVTKKIGAPNNQELAIGAIAEDGEAIFDHQFIEYLDIEKKYLENTADIVREKIREYIGKFRNGKELELKKNVILVDDGIATGQTVMAAIAWLNARRCQRIVLATPIVSREVLLKISPLVSSCCILELSSSFNAVGQFYEHFDQVDDSDVVKLLKLGKH
jgi:predicted phosphoribosyltransferase